MSDGRLGEEFTCVYTKSRDFQLQDLLTSREREKEKERETRKEVFQSTLAK